MNKTDYFVTIVISIFLGAMLIYFAKGLYDLDPFEIAVGGTLSMLVIAILSNYGRNLPK